MKLLSITLATLVAAAIALPAPKDTYSIMKRQLGSDNNEGEGAPWKRADGATGHGSSVTIEGEGSADLGLAGDIMNKAYLGAAGSILTVEGCNAAYIKPNKPCVYGE